MISIGDGLAVAFKIESHNHPSAVEPYQGAATGVGGILRDMFAMGARPIAVLDALRFGDPSDPRTRHLVDGVVRGVGGYGNCVGVPTVGGELVFDPSYQGNPLVNVMAIGLLEDGMLTRASADGAGNLVVLYGSATGRDGIGGASVLASATFGDQETSGRWLAGASPRPSVGEPQDSMLSKRPSVQVGDPFAEKLLIEATLELIATGLVVGVQDLGAAGITCATCETADRGGTGMLVDLDAIPRREPGLEPFEVMISESQERMVAIVEPHRWQAVRAVCERWDLPVAVIGRVTVEPDIVVLTAPDGSGALDADGRPVPGARELARIPATALASGAIVFQRESRAPTRRRAAPAPGAPSEPVDTLPVRGQDPGAVLLALLGSPNLSSRRSVYEQYDHNVQANTVAGPGRGAAVLRIKGTTKALVATTDGNAPVGVLDPWLGAAMSVAEAARNVSITGARPLGVTNCLNYGDPTRPEAFWQLTEAVRGLSDACLALGLPVTGGNVSLYNESPGSAIAPTPEIGIVGLLDDVEKRVGPAFRADGNAVLLVGQAGAGLAGSEYARLAGAGPDDGPPALDLAFEARLQAFIREAIDRGLVESCQDVSGGGLAVALAEMAIWGERGRAGPAARSAARRRSACSARARAGSCARLRRATSRRSSCSLASTACRATSSGRPAARGWSSSSRAKAPPAPRRSGEAGRRRPRRLDRRPAPRVGARAATGPRLGGATPDVRRRRRRPARSRPRGGGRRRDGAVRAPAPRPGVGRHRRLGRPQPDDLQGPGHGQPGARRAADPVAAGRPRRGALPVLDHGLDSLGERTANAPPRPAAGPRHRPQRQPRQHP